MEMIKKNLPKVSVMIPTYNQEKYIAQAIESVLSQDYENIEIVIADDCSSDRTGEIAQIYQSDPRVKYYRNEKNLGRVGNYRNTLYSHTTGDWVVNLDGDDFYTDKTFISRAIKRVLSQDNIVCFFGGKNFPSKLRCYKKYKISKDAYCFPGKLYLKKYSEIGHFAHLATIYNRKIAITDGKCYTFDGIQSDFHAIVRLSVYGNVIVSKESGYTWRVHTENATNAFQDFRIKYLQGIRCQNRIMSDIGDNFSPEEKMQWIKNGKKNVKRMFVMDNLRFNYSLHSLKLGLQNFRFNRGYAILYIKSALMTIFRINLF